MYYYIYDGSVNGLLSVIYATYNRPEKPDNIVTDDNFTAGLFIEAIKVQTDHTHADKVATAIADKISTQALRHIYRCYLSELPNIEMDIYYYLRLGFKVGAQVDNYLHHQFVLNVHQNSEKVGKERHRLLGLVRFRCLENSLYYAPIEPDYNVLPLIAPHFVKRLADQNWVIHDLKRNMAALYNGKDWVLTELASDIELDYGEQETFYQNLWRDYFSSATVTSRLNPKLQRQFMPKRYWRHLIEKQ